MLTFILLTLQAIAPGGSPQPADCHPSRAEAETPRCLIDAFVAAMQEAHRRAVASKPRAVSRIPSELAAELLYGIKLRRQGNSTAVGLISPYREHPDSTVREAAELTVTALVLMTTMDATMEGAIKASLDGVDTLTPAQRADLQSDYQLSRRIAAEGLMAAAGAVVSAIAATDPATGRVSCRRLSTRDVSELLSTLDRGFGKDLEARSDGTFASDFAVAARMLRDSLRDRAWRPCA